MNDYDQIARLYDLEHQDLTADIELYANFALRCDGPVLELGCGSGRVCLALAAAGFDVTGIDSSPAMLALARARAAQAGLHVPLIEADVRSLDLDAGFALAVYPLNGFLHLLTIQDQRAALQQIHRALLPGGFLLLDLPNPHTVLNPDTDSHLLLRRCFFSPEGHSISSLVSTETDLAEQLQYMTLFYDEVDETGLVRRTTVETTLRFVYQYEMAALLRAVGYELDTVYGSYDLDPYTAASELMLFVAHTTGMSPA